MTDLTTPQSWAGPARRGTRSTPIALVLVALGDALLRGTAPGLGLFVYALAIATGIVLVWSRLPPSRSLAAFGLLVLVAALPLAEAVTLLSLALALSGLVLLALAAARLLPAHLAQWPRVLIRFLLLAPIRLVADAIRLATTGIAKRLGLSMSRGLIVWVVPLAFAAIFLALFASANPVIEDALGHLNFSMLLDLFDPLRIAFWIILALVLWPLLMPRLLPRGRRRPTAVTQTIKPDNPLFGHAAILRSLLLFNAVFAIQTLLDLTYLWGGANLPDGMTHADYAHRGAYPLIVTALLAAAFVLAAMRPGGAGEQSPMIRRLVYAWIAQNILLCISSILRLDLYVEVYSLTELRIAAGIWMGLVALGLALIMLRIVLRRSNAWLVAVNLATLMLTLYACAWIDFAAVISRFNVEHSREVSGQGQPLDLNYLASLGPSAIPAIELFLEKAPLSPGRAEVVRAVRLDLIRQIKAHPDDWRAWSFRQWRQEQHVAALAPLAQSDNN